MQLPQVWLSPLDQPMGLPLTWLDARERERLHRFKRPEAAARFHLCRTMLKAAVAELEQSDPAQITLEYSDNGKPFLPGVNRPFFSISHSKTAVAVALAPFEIGVDLETRLRANSPWNRPEGFLHPQEAARVRAQLDEAGRAHVFTHCWTCQEAAIKLLDSSVFRREAQVLLDADGSSGTCCGKTVHFASWWPDVHRGTASCTHRDGDYVLSLAARQPIGQVVFKRWTGWEPA